MNVRILCTGDTQLDKSFGTLGDSATAFRKQLLSTFKRVMAEAKDYDLVLVAGDVFDREGTPTGVIEEVADVFAACKTPTVVLAGNHDSLKSGIPRVLHAALAQRNAAHVFVPLQREPLLFPELGVTVYPVPLANRGDLSNQYDWIPEREEEQGVRVALMHGALDSIPDGTIPTNVATIQDLDLVVCGDQHGPSHGDEHASVLFNSEVSIQRRLVYAMAPEAQHINQGFVGAYTEVVMTKTGEIETLNRIEVGELRFLNSTVSLGEEEGVEDALDEAMSPVQDRAPELTSIRLTLEGNISHDQNESLQVKLSELSSNWPLLEVRNRTIVIDEDSTEDQGTDDPILRLLKSKAKKQNLDAHMVNRITELYKINKGRWL